jgi:hypothetical protein
MARIGEHRSSEAPPRGVDGHCGSLSRFANVRRFPKGASLRWFKSTDHPDSIERFRIQSTAFNKAFA